MSRKNKKKDRVPEQERTEIEEMTINTEENPDAEAVFITSPTYEGVVSDVEAIAGVATGAISQGSRLRG